MRDLVKRDHPFGRAPLFLRRSAPFDDYPEPAFKRQAFAPNTRSTAVATRNTLRLSMPPSSAPAARASHGGWPVPHSCDPKPLQESLFFPGAGLSTWLRYGACAAGRPAASSRCPSR